MKQKIGFIGQGWIGRHYADDFEQRGFNVVRYAKDPQYQDSVGALGECDIVFIAVPTPTTPHGFDDSIIRQVIKLVGKGRTAVIKSTIVPGTTESIQHENPDIFVFHSPEFLREANAAYDAAHPDRNIIGIGMESKEARVRAEAVIGVLPEAPFSLITGAKEAELIKYAGNCFLYEKVVFMNMLYDLSLSVGADFESIRVAFAADPRIGGSHTNPVHTSGHGDVPGRGAGGHCFIKDFAAFSKMYEARVKDKEGKALLKSFQEKNTALLKESGKDLDLLEGVYGKDT